MRSELGTRERGAGIGRGKVALPESSEDKCYLSWVAGAGTEPVTWTVIREGPWAAAGCKQGGGAQGVPDIQLSPWGSGVDVSYWGRSFEVAAAAWLLGCREPGKAQAAEPRAPNTPNPTHSWHAPGEERSGGGHGVSAAAKRPQEDTQEGAPGPARSSDPPRPS